MDYRTRSFTDKFQSAALILKCGSPHDIISLKVRGPAMPSEYHELVAQLQHESELDVTPVKGDFAGQAWAVSLDSTDRIILVEHETGLEILYVAGSIASLGALVPIIVSGWNSLRRHFGNAHRHGIADPVESRRFDTTGTLVEQRINNLATVLVETLRAERESNAGKIAVLEKQVRDLERQLAAKSKASHSKAVVRKKGKTAVRKSSKR